MVVGKYWCMKPMIKHESRADLTSFPLHVLDKLIGIFLADRLKDNDILSFDAVKDAVFINAEPEESRPLSFDFLDQLTFWKWVSFEYF